MINPELLTSARSTSPTNQHLLQSSPWLARLLATPILAAARPRGHPWVFLSSHSSHPIYQQGPQAQTPNAPRTARSTSSRSTILAQAVIASCLHHCSSLRAGPLPLCLSVCPPHCSQSDCVTYARSRRSPAQNPPGARLIWTMNYKAHTFALAELASLLFLKH